jgi:zinc transporter ZupT
MAYFFAGVVLFALLELLVAPAHDHDGESHSGHIDPSDADLDTPKKAGLRKRKNATKPTTRSSSKSAKSRGETAELKRMGMITFLALFIHNIPEVRLSYFDPYV